MSMRLSPHLTIGGPAPDRPAGCPDYRRINRDDFLRIFAIAKRAEMLTRFYRSKLASGTHDDVLEANFELISIDIADVFLMRGLDLQAFLYADDLAFMREYAIIEKNLNRGLHLFPTHVEMRFASIGAKTPTP